VKDLYSHKYATRASASLRKDKSEDDWKESYVPPPFVLEYYPTLFREIRKQSPAETYIARLALWYLDDLSLFCKRPLDFKEFTHVLTLWADGLPFGLSHEEYQQRILKACCGLLRPTTKNSSLEWAHWTIGTYHREKKQLVDRIMDYSEKPMFSPTTALKLLTSDLLASGPCSHSDLETRLSDLPLLEYVSLYWGWSPESPEAQDWSTTLCRSALEFLLDEAKRQASLQVVVYLNSRRGKELKVTPLFGIAIDSSPLHLAAAFGLHRIVGHLIHKNYNPRSKDANGNTPLSLASRAHSREQNHRRKQPLIRTLEFMKWHSNSRWLRGPLLADKAVGAGQADHLEIPDLDVVGERLEGVWSRNGESSSLFYDRHLSITPTSQDIKQWKIRNSN
jgi:hypothetical protein